MSLDNSIVSQSPTKGKAHDDMPQLPDPLQKGREAP
jgi:hypothetical protein